MIPVTVEPDRHAIANHLGSLHQCAEGLNGVLVLAAFGEDPVTGQALAPMVEHFAIGNVIAMTDRAMEWTVQPHRNVYAPLVVMRHDLPAADKGGEKDIVNVLGLCADFDDADASQWSTRSPITPTAILETSPGRFQVFYLFTSPLEQAPAKDLARRLQAHTQCDFGTKDLSHVWRGTGTLNQPNKKKLDAGRSPEPFLVREIPGGTSQLVDPAALGAALPLLAPPVSQATHRPARPVDLNDQTLIEKMLHAKNGSKARALWNGELNGYPSHNEGDLALANILAFWCGRDEVRVDALFRQSGLMREKWNERRGDSTYGADTIARACANCPETYTPSRPAMTAEAPADGPDETDLTRAQTPEFVPNPMEAASPDREPERTAPFQLVTAPDSFISHYVTYATTRTDAPAEAHEALAFGILSVAASYVRLPIATSPRGWSLVLWILYLVNSTAGRKSTVIDLAIDLVREVVGEAALIFWEGSPQGLLQRLQARDGEATVFVRDEYASLMAAFNKNGHLSGLPQVLIKAFDGSPLENVRTKKKGPDGEKHSDTDRVEHPFLAQFAAAPWDAFIQWATVDNLLDGFLPRFVVITGAAAGRPLPLLTPSITAARAALYAQLNTYTLRAQSIQHVLLAPDVLEAQWSLEQTFLRQAETSCRPDAAGPSLKRLAETALKVAALLAIEDATNGVLSIRGEHFDLARLIATRWAESSVRLVEALGATSFQKECSSVFQTIQQRPGVSVSLLYRTHRRLRKREFDEILEALDLQGRIRIETQPTNAHGRPPRVVYPIGGTAV